MGEYRKSNILKYTRKSLGLTQEFVCESICDPVTMSRYENGVLDPSDIIFYRLMKRMGKNINLIHINMPKEFIIMDNVMKATTSDMEKGEFHEAINLIKKLQNINSPYDIPEIEQFCGRIETIIEYIHKEITVDDALQRLSKLLQKTDIDSGKHLNRQIYTDSELLLYYNIAILSNEKGNTVKSIEMFHSLEEYILHREKLTDPKSRYIIFLHYSNILGQMGEYKKSISICKREIRWLYNNNKANYLYNYYYNIGWNIFQLNRCKLNKNCKKISMVYLWTAYKLCEFYPENKGNLKRILETMRKVSKA
ncbi:MAG: helix-turn-helix transcriptional regulator [Lachnospiraceae bacterium]|jgi:transcriptional regulator with XRE-family HTH domain|nr:helix-turn-helix transcriptional regulator [Lachnospiraceae bacterium]